MKRVRKQSFTLVEVIAVLLVIGILAAVAAPKFVNIATDARLKVAQAGINEAKASLSVAYAKAYLAREGDHANVTVGDVVTNANFTSGSPVTFGDVVVTITANETSDEVELESVTVKGTAAVTEDAWALPTQ